MGTKTPPHDPTREELISICQDGIVPEERWCNRDSAAAQRQLGEALALLTAGCGYRVLRGDSLNTNERTIWIEIEFAGFGHFDWGGHYDSETYYLPTRERLNANHESDWY